MSQIQSQAMTGFVPKGVPVVATKLGGEVAISNLLLLALGLFFVLPLVWLVVASVDSGATQQLQWPHFTIANYIEATSPSKADALLNSLILSCIATAVSTVPAIFAAYAFSRRTIPAKNPILMSILFLSVSRSPS